MSDAHSDLYRGSKDQSRTSPPSYWDEQYRREAGEKIKSLESELATLRAKGEALDRLDALLGDECVRLIRKLTDGAVYVVVEDNADHVQRDGRGPSLQEAH